MIIRDKCKKTGKIRKKYLFYTLFQEVCKNLFDLKWNEIMIFVFFVDEFRFKFLTKRIETLYQDAYKWEKPYIFLDFLLTKDRKQSIIYFKNIFFCCYVYRVLS